MDRLTRANTGRQAHELLPSTSASRVEEESRVVGPPISAVVSCSSSFQQMTGDELLWGQPALLSLPGGDEDLGGTL